MPAERTIDVETIWAEVGTSLGRFVRHHVADPHGSLAWGMVADGFRPDRFDLIGAAVCLLGVGVVVFAPR